MNITSFQVRCVNVPMPEPHRTASGVVAVSPLVLLTVATDAGVLGHSITFSYSPAAHKPLGDLMKNLEPLAVGKPLAPVALSDQLHGRFKLLGTQGLVGMALAGIDMALWDAFARAQELPLHALAGRGGAPIKAYGGVGYDGAEGTAKAAEAWATQGHSSGVKAKIGYPTLAEDLAVIRAMRSAVGPGVALMVDYNQSLDAGRGGQAPASAGRRRAGLDRGAGARARLRRAGAAGAAHAHAAAGRARTGGGRWIFAMRSTPACAASRCRTP